MKKKLFLLFLAVCLFGMALPSRSVRAEEASGSISALHTTNNRIVDSSGKPFVIHGISTHGINWFPQIINEVSFRNFKNDFHLNTVRLAMYTADYNGYCTGGNQAELESLIDKGVRLCEQENLYCVIDWHILSDSNPLEHEAQAKTFFEKMARQYGSLPNVIFEICNEPNGGTTWQQVRQYASAVIPIIRQYSSNLILVGTPTWSQEIDKPAADPLPYSNVAYTLHFYAATHKEDLRRRYEQAADKIPVLVSEYGICAADGNAPIDTQSTDAWMKALDKYSTGRILWNASNKNEASSILLPSANMENWNTSSLSECGKWLLGQSGQAPSPDLPTDPNPKDVKGRIVLDLQQTNAWMQESSHFTQLAASVLNDGALPTEFWSFTVRFPVKISVSQSWNCKVSQSDDQTLVISNADYNGVIPSLQTINDPGLILCSDDPLSVSDLQAVPTEAAGPIQSDPMYRLYNPNSGEHFYTKQASERDTLVKAGWTFERIGWYAPSYSGIPVYRLYNPNAGDHVYTKKRQERDDLIGYGWRYEGVGWYSADEQGIAIYREYNPNAKTGTHNYTADIEENDHLVDLGWRGEGIAFYGSRQQ